MMWTGQWRRPHSYGDAAAEVRAVHEILGMIDVSTLGKIVVEGPDAGDAARPPLPEPVHRPQAGSHPLRRPDDRRRPYLRRRHRRAASTTSSSTSPRRRPARLASCEWFEWWNAVWGYDVEIVNLTGAIAAMNVAGPRAREALASLTDADVSNEALRLSRRA